HRRKREAGDDGVGIAVAGEPRHARGAREAWSARGLVPGLLAGDLGRRSPRSGGGYVFGRGPPRGGPRVPGPEHRRIGDLTPTADRAMGDVPVRDELDRTVRVPDADRTSGTQASLERQPAMG